jgi:dTDP-4-dehydrorhamnose 3,5-epimerase
VIDGVEIKKLVTNVDQRGFFRELIRSTDPIFREGFGQWSVSMMHTGIAKAWHVHQRQIDWWYVASGVLKVALHDTRPDSHTHRETDEIVMGEHQEPIILRIPPGVAHGCKCLQGPSLLFYITSHTYDPSDEGRIPHDDPVIGYDWIALPAVS